MPKGNRDPWNEIRLPNAGSKLATPASLKIDLHYAHLGVWDRWDWERFIRLAKFLNLTLAELASLACIPHRALEQFERRNRIHNGGAKDVAAALLLTLLEAHVCREYSRDVLPNPFPNLNHMPRSSATSSQSEPTPNARPPDP